MNKFRRINNDFLKVSETKFEKKKKQKLTLRQNFKCKNSKLTNFFLLPATIAASHCSCLIASIANCIARREEEQAVSTEKDGPRRSKANDRRLENIERTHPVNV